MVSDVKGQINFSHFLFSVTIFDRRKPESRILDGKGRTFVVKIQGICPPSQVSHSGDGSRMAIKVIERIEVEMTLFSLRTGNSK